MSPLSRSFVAAVTCASLGACLHVHVHNQQTPQGGLGLEPGDRVVARWRDGLFDATVITVTGRLVEIAWDTPPPERSQVSRIWVAPATNHPASLSKGDWVICRSGDGWQACHVDAAVDDVVTVTAPASGERERARLGELLAIPDGLRDWLVGRGEAALAKLQLQRDLDRLRPASAGSAVVPGQRVLARWQGTSWWIATVKSVQQTVVVTWADGSGDAELDASGVAPVPATAAPLGDGDLAFCAWSDSARWWRARIAGKTGDRLEVEYVDGSRSVVAAADCIPAVRDGSLSDGDGGRTAAAAWR